MSEIPMYPDECAHHREPEQCWECLTTELVRVRDALRVKDEWGQGLVALTSHLQAELDQQRGSADRLATVADAVRAYVESDDEDRVEEFDAMVTALKGLQP